MIAAAEKPDRYAAPAGAVKMLLPRPASAARRSIPPSTWGARGWRSRCFPVLSDDFMGDMLRHAYSPAWIIRPQPARRYRPLAFVRAGRRTGALYLYDENSAGRMLTENDLPTLGDDVSAVLFRMHQPDSRTVRQRL